ncbi:aspartyl-phosphate phosphatase Spo0E family protein [Paenibacillus ihumii]|uniref:aspartyl-phosphate phosphatase Spo0E family protein n=1 Tax=Paenibacillus ihumii TaxID=687436 RepID=UPI0009395849|nr:aspartyl-phosphate phosphatase Spo0E family protein [Paenibacillus ihumii]
MAYKALNSMGRTANRPKVSGELMNTIENLRSELMNAAGSSNFSSKTVLELSQRLDKYIVQAQNQMLGKQDFASGVPSASRIKECTSSEYRFGSTL